MSEDNDPEMLPPQERIRYAEQLIRAEHKMLDDDWMFWREVADHLNYTAHVPDQNSQRASDWRAFNRAKDMATGYIRMSAAGFVPPRAPGRLAVDDRQRQVIRRGYLEGLTEQEMAAGAGADEASVIAYLAWWCDRGCPPGEGDA